MMLAFSRSMFWKLFIPIGILLILSAIAAAIYLPSVIQSNAEQEAVSAGQDTVRQFKVLRQYYTENVVAKVLAKSGMSISSDHHNNPNAVPLPATMIHDMSELMKDAGTTLKLYSPYPFPNRKNRVLDKFGADAWTFFQTNPDKTFFRTESVGNNTVVRVAIADRMSAPACVACHNSVAGSPKTDWKLGDVRGVLEVDSSKQIASGQRIVSDVLATLGVIMLLLAVFLRFFYQRSIARPLNTAVDAARALTQGSAEKLSAVEAIANGNLTQDVAVAPAPTIDPKALSEDEVGQLLKSVVGMSEVQASLDQAFRKMTAALRQSRETEAARDWMKTGQNELNTLMRGEQDTAELANKVLCFLAERLKAGAGALYLFDERTGELHLTASYALVRRVDLQEHFRLGEGLIGQAALERRTICLADVPADYTPISSAVGEAMPRNVTAVPLLHADTLVGALEIASFDAFNAAEQEFLEHAREGIAIGFGVNLSRRRMQELLEQTQQQAEELRIQQEELQQSNEELEERAEMLERQREQLHAKRLEIESASRKGDRQ